MKSHWSDTLRSPTALLCFLGVAALGLFIDLWTKALAVEHLRYEAPIRFIPYIVRFEYTENRGAVFGLGQGRQYLFLAVSVLAIGYLVWLFVTSGKSRILQVILGMLTAGVIGNMYDRLTFGYVRDMIHGLPGVHWPAWIADRLPQHWRPASGQPMEVFPWIFNVADSLLCVGVAAMIVYLLLSERQRKKMLDSQSAPVTA
jgi:signal peptidase II